VTTGDESAAALEGELDSALSDFDRKMREEMERRAEEATAQGGGYQGSSESGSSGGGSGSASEGPSSDETGESAGGDSAEEGGSSGGAVGGGGPGGDDEAEVPSDVGDGSDDDIVARQLREAAMAEKDPEMRERLWDEYRRYKGSVSGSGGD
jgi:hypothetical protein